MAISKDGQTIVSGSYDKENVYRMDEPTDKTIKVWNSETGELLHTLKGHSSYVTSVAISSDDQRIVSGSLDNTIKVWNIETGQLLRTLEGHSDWVNSVAISKDGTIVSGSADTDIRVWKNQL